jgi:hypothetical protein
MGSYVGIDLHREMRVLLMRSMMSAWARASTLCGPTPTPTACSSFEGQTTKPTEPPRVSWRLQPLRRMESCQFVVRPTRPR